ncbi:MAG: hypothetical protein EZS28_030014 [Streblomastix strix]|uniref:Uncharacterized protein n=1 Tax=Streblomastix strix TaxID=222440 RepID=A0A5J4UVH4_9EUKA|nr:MAG: hypothetical protein EZS28_030014 [Streblomastix strix]
MKCRKCTRQFNWGKRLFKPSAPGDMRNVDIDLDHEQFISRNQYEIWITDTIVIFFSDTLAWTILSIISQQGADSEGNQTQRQNSTTRNYHYVMEIDMESKGRDINPTPLEAKINHASFIGQREYWATKSYLLKYFDKRGAGQHQPGYEERQIEEHEVILRHASIGLQQRSKTKEKN